MPSTWRDYLPTVLAEREAGSDNSDDSDKRVGEAPSGAPNVPNVAIVTASESLPGDLANGLLRLGSMVPPRLRSPEQWAAVVADAHRLASDGWALQALKLGWSALDLFGAVTDTGGDPDAGGLAVRLGGRRLLPFCAEFATVDDGNGGRIFLYRGRNEGARLLWDLGRPQ